MLKEKQARLDGIIDCLRQREFRVTPQRIAIIEAFLKREDHPGIDTIFKQVKRKFPTTSLSTLYKTVNLLKEIGSIQELVFSNERIRYEVHNLTPHPHMMCTRCKVVIHPEFRRLDRVVKEAEQSSGFRSLTGQIIILGRCPDCR